MGNIKKINGHNIKDDIARTRADIITEGFDEVIAEFDLLKIEIDNLENQVSDSIDVSDKIENLETNLQELELNISNLGNEVATNTQEIEDLKSMIGNATIVPPTYLSPTFNVTITPTYVEHNILTTVTIKPSYTQNDAGDIVRYEIFKDNLRLSSTTSVNNFTDSLIIPHGDTTEYRAVITYGNGPIKNNSLGTPYPDGAIIGGTIEKTISIRAYAPCYYGVIDNDFNITLISQMNSKVSTTKNNTFNYTLERQKSVYMYPASFGELTSIRDANNFNYINSYTKSNITYNEVDYLVYVLTDPVSITNFEQTFN